MPTEVPISGLSIAHDAPRALGAAVHFTASVVSGVNVSYTWDFGDGSSGAGQTASRIYLGAGVYPVTLVGRNAGSALTVTAPVTVTEPPISGLAASASLTAALGAPTRFTASVASGGANVLFQWRFGDGQTGNGPSVSHIYAAAGVYTALVTATNSAGSASASLSTTILSVATKIDCTQSALIGAINAAPNNGTINLDGNCRYLLTSATFTSAFSGLSGVLIDANKGLIVEGNGAIIERAPGAPAFRLLISTKPGLTIRNVTLRNGQPTLGGGGAIQANAVMTLSGVALENNRTTTGDGGALNANSAVNLVNTTFLNNAASGYGGALAFVPAFANSPLNVDRSAFFSNTALIGGGFYVQGTDARVTNTLFAENTAGNSGSAIYANSTATLTLQHSVVRNALLNPGRAVYIWGPGSVQNSIIVNQAMGVVAGTAGKSVTENYNVFYGNNANTSAVNGASVVSGGASKAADPKFVDAVNRNFRLLSTSPAIDAGAPSGSSVDADGNPRPYPGAGIDSGAYEYQGAGSPSLSIVKQGAPWIAAAQAMTFVIQVSNNSLFTATNLRVTEQLPAGAAWVHGGSFGGGAVTWDLPLLSPNTARAFTYTAVPSQTLVSASYWVTSANNSAVVAYGPVVTIAVKNILGASPFRPNPDGFSFANFGDIQDSDLTANDLIKLFGADKVCKTQTGGCVLTAAAEQWRLAWLQVSTGGHCFGMAVASEGIWRDPVLTPGQFQAGAGQTFDLAKANARGFVMQNFLLQGTQPLTPANAPMSVTATGAMTVVNALLANFNAGIALDDYVLTFRKLDGSGGHAVSPYAVEQASAGEYWIYVYDNNYPNNNDRVFKVNAATNGWVYDGGAINPLAPPSTYTGTATSNTIQVSSVNRNRNYPKNCLFCKNGTGTITGRLVLSNAVPVTNAFVIAESGSSGTTPAATRPDANGYYTLTQLFTGTYQLTPKSGSAVFAPVNRVVIVSAGTLAPNQNFTVTSGAPALAQSETNLPGKDARASTAERVGMLNILMSGEGRILVTRGDGARVGQDAAGNIINEIPGATTQDLLLGSELNTPPSLLIPHDAGMTYSIRIASTANAFLNDVSTVDVMLIAPGSVVRLQGLALNGGAQVDVSTLGFAPDANEVSFQTSALDGDMPSVLMALSPGNGPDYTLRVNDVDLGPNQALRMVFDAANGRLTLENNASAVNTMSLNVERLNTDGSRDLFASAAITDGARFGAVLELGYTWDGVSAPVISALDARTLPPALLYAYLPMVRR